MSLFDLFKHADPAEEARVAAYQARQAESVRALVAGGLPLDAVDRLHNQRARQGTAEHFWTSDLSVNELALSRDCGFEPLGQVLGASTYHVGWQWLRMNSWYSGAAYELEILTDAFTRARGLALSRLWQEAQLLGAHGVIGVRIEKRDAGWGADLMEFSAIGTAIRLTAAPPPPNGPWLCDLSGQDFWKLHQAGWEPVGVAAGNCSYMCIPSRSTENILTTSDWLGRGSANNQEVGEFTQAMFQARELAQNRLNAEVQALGGTGVVGMTIENDVERELVEVRSNDTRTAMRFNFLAIGTAIRPRANGGELQVHGALPLKFMRVGNREFSGRL